ncbi:MAG: hypothetical protein CMH27_06550 [Micavibrio sp.]|nr:hypothetical protein [Micavibrio sp.]|tara:strand:- start:2639 stop:3049 length:411 start_codon:yes stop_codon:yes gene_type:complete
MIGPHEGRELDLMLAGEKSLAVFHDLYVDGDDIPEDIIPERAFAPYVAQGKIMRLETIVTNARNGDRVKFVCFTLPGQEWRAQFYLWIEESVFSKELKYNPAHDEIVGKLLGYSNEDIRDFLKKKRGKSLSENDKS